MAPRKPFLLRLSPALLSELSHWAEDELRSLNGQIEYLLRDAVRTHRKRLLEENANNPENEAR